MTSTAKLKDHLEKLEAFFKVAQEKSFRRAADSLHVAQPSLSRAVQMLEDAVGGALFVRLSGGVSLTQRGQILFNYCNQLFAEIKNLESQMQEPQEPLSGHIRVGTYESIAIYFWPKFLKGFLAHYPRISLDITTARSAQLFDALKANELDLIVSVEPPPSKDFVCLELYRDHYGLYQSSEMKIDEGTYLNDPRLPLIYMPDALSSARESLTETLSRCGLSFARQFTTTSFETVKALTREGLGIGILPRRVAADDLARGRLTEVKLYKESECLGQHRICACYPLRESESPVYTKFVSSLKGFFEKASSRTSD